MAVTGISTYEKKKEKENKMGLCREQRNWTKAWIQDVNID